MTFKALNLPQKTDSKTQEPRKQVQRIHCPRQRMERGGSTSQRQLENNITARVGGLL